MVHVATAGDVAEAEELQEILRNAGIDSSIEQSAEEDAVNLLVPEAELETAKEAIEALTEPDELFSRIPGVEGWRCEGPGSYVLSVSDSRTAAPEVTRGLVAAGADVLSISEAQHSLEDVYLELIDEDVEARRS